MRIRSCELCAFWVGSWSIWEIENVGKYENVNWYRQSPNISRFSTTHRLTISTGYFLLYRILSIKCSGYTFPLETLSSKTEFPNALMGFPPEHPTLPYLELLLQSSGWREPKNPFPLQVLPWKLLWNQGLWSKRTNQMYLNISTYIPVVPGQAGGGSFQSIKKT